MSEVPPSVPGLVRFGSFELDPRSGELRKAGVRLGLQEQSLQVLILLLARPGQLVTREELRQRLWPGDAFGDFDHGLNAVINRLRDTLGDSADTPRFVETLPRRGYRFIAPVDGHRPTDQAGTNGARVQADVQPTDIPPATASDRSEHPKGWFSTERPGLRTGIAAVTAIVLIGVAAGAWRLRRAPAPEAPPPQVVPLTTLKGWEGHPTFSPDGTQIAFTWSGGKGDNPWDGSIWDTYVKIIGSEEVRRVTTSHPGWNWSPAWSPDGRHIAFVRCEPGGFWVCHAYLTSPLGGAELKVSDLWINFPGIAWSPDSHYVAAGRARRDDGIGGIYLMPAQGGKPRAITRPPVDTVHRAPAFSPDGHHLAYVSCVFDDRGCDVFSVDVDTSFTPVGAARRVTTETIASIQIVTWTRDGKSLLYDTEAVPFVNYIWRVAADGTRPPERVELAGFGSSLPATVPSQDRLAFQRSWYNEDIYQSTVGHPPQPLVTSSFPELNPQFSPDGRHIVFCSPRSGDTLEIWVADADGSGEHQLLHGPNRWQSSPQWSPDGRLIAFDSHGADGHWHVWIVDAEGGQPHQVVVDAGEQHVPTWSHDGHWIYFSSGDNIWRVPVAGGRREQITQGGAWYFSSESKDGKNLLYQKDGGALMTVPLAGGPARQVLPCVPESYFMAGAKGIYYVPCDAGPDPLVHLLNPTTGETRALMALSSIEYRMLPNGLAVSPDGNSVLYVKVGSAGDDLMLIENFH